MVSMLLSCLSTLETNQLPLCPVTPLISLSAYLTESVLSTPFLDTRLRGRNVHPAWLGLDHLPQDWLGGGSVPHSRGATKSTHLEAGTGPGSIPEPAAISHPLLCELCTVCHHFLSAVGSFPEMAHTCYRVLSPNARVPPHYCLLCFFPLFPWFSITPHHSRFFLLYLTSALGPFFILFCTVS